MKFIQLLPFLNTNEPDMDETHEAEDAEKRRETFEQLKAAERAIRADLKQLVDVQRRVLSDRRNRI